MSKDMKSKPWNTIHNLQGHKKKKELRLASVRRKHRGAALFIKWGGPKIMEGGSLELEAVPTAAITKCT